MQITEIPDIRRALYMAQVAEAMYTEPLDQEAAKLKLAILVVVEPDAAISTKVGLFAHGDDVIIAFRGTPKFVPAGTLEDWRQALLAWLYNADIFDEGVSARTVCDSFEGVVHRGFAELLNHLWPRFTAALKSVADGAAIWLCGHSQGGALAVLAAERLKHEGRNVQAVYTFGAPRAGDTAFVETYRATVIRYENADDIVPLLPPSGPWRDLINEWLWASSPEAAIQLGPTSFRHVGRLQYIHWDGGIRAGETKLEWARTLRFLNAVASKKLRSKLVRDHSMAQYVTAMLRNLDAAHIAAVDADRAETIRRFNDTIRTAFEQSLAPNAQPSMQLLADKMEELALIGVVDSAGYAALTAVAETATEHLEGQLRNDWIYLRQAALWTIGMLNAGIDPGVPTLELPAMDLVAGIVRDSSSYPEDVACAAVQALQVLRRSTDPSVQAILASASSSPHGEVRRLIAKALSGEMIAFPQEVEGRRGHAQTPEEQFASARAIVETIRTAYRASLAPHVEAMQRLVDNMEGLAVFGVGDEVSYSILMSIAQTWTSDLEGQLREDWNYLRQAALWSIGMLNAGIEARVPIVDLPAIPFIAGILSDSGSYPEDVACAAVQSIQVLNRPQDPTVRAMLMSASKSVHSEVRQLVERALAGQVIVRSPLQLDPHKLEDGAQR